MDVPAPAPAAPAPRKDFYQTMDARAFREKAAARPESRPAAHRSSSPEMGGRLTFRDVRQPELRKQEAPARPAGAFTVRTFEPKAVPAPKAELPRPAPVEEKREVPEQTSLETAPAPWRFAGEVLRTYIIAEDGENVWLIDKHAAHERINFDRLKAALEPPMRQALLKANTEPVMRQQLLASMAVELPGEQYAALLENLPLLEEFGFEAEDFGEGCLMVRAVPADLDAGLARETLEELADKLLNGGGADPAAARDAMLHTMACKASIKGGWESDPAELRVLIDKVQSGEVQFCPHGRPVKVKLSKYEIEKMFKRA